MSSLAEMHFKQLQPIYPRLKLEQVKAVIDEGKILVVIKNEPHIANDLNEVRKMCEGLTWGDVDVMTRHNILGTGTATITTA